MAESLREHLVAFFEEQQKLVEAEALRLLLESHHPLLVSREVVDRAGAGSGFVTADMVVAVLGERRPSAGPAARSGGASPANRRPTPVEGFALLQEGFQPPPPAATPLDGFSRLFQSRYRALERLLRGRPALPNLRPIRELRPADGTASVIGMVREIRETQKRRHLLVTIDDASGTLEMLVAKDSPGGRLPFVPDEVIGARLRLGRSEERGPGRIPLAVGIERPDVPTDRTVGRAERPARVLFLSDLHIGSRSFLSAEWSRLVDFLRERGPRPELARSIDHVVIAGDLVDGIGIYPRQERDLAIPDIVEQYAELGRRLAELPARLTIVVVPGNHDAVCSAEPQPALPPTLVEELPTNVRALANPSTFALDGVVVEAYHGRGFDDLIPMIPGASYGRPTEVMRRMLQMRHLGPIYGDRTPLAPLAHDGLVIDPLPDILVTGHLHTYAADRYRGVLMLNASAWQSETEYQRMRNIVPVPAHAAVVDLASLDLATVDCTRDPVVVTAEGPA